MGVIESQPHAQNSFLHWQMVPDGGAEDEEERRTFSYVKKTHM